MRRWRRSTAEAGAAVVDFVLVALVLLPLFLGLVQVGIVLHVRNAAAAAATEGARYAARSGSADGVGVARARDQLDGVVGDRFVDAVLGRDVVVDGVALAEVEIRLHVPALGWWGPGVALDVVGHGVREGGR